MRARRTLKWTAIGPIALVVIALLAVVWFDATKGGEAKPAPPIGTIGTPVRQAYVAPTATPIGFQATPRPRPTVPIGGGGTIPKGNPAERDARRRADVLVLIDAANKIRARDGSYVTTGGNVQTLCAFQNLDVGCKLKDVIAGNVLPLDPFGDPVKNGYWYSSDGQTAKVYAALEGDVPVDQKCPTNDVELKKKPNLICVTTP